MCNSIFIGCFCVVFHCNTYELYRLFSIQIVIHIGLNNICNSYYTIINSIAEYMASVLKHHESLLKKDQGCVTHTFHGT